MVNVVMVSTIEGFFNNINQSFTFKLAGNYYLETLILIRVDNV